MMMKITIIMINIKTKTHTTPANHNTFITTEKKRNKKKRKEKKTHHTSIDKNNPKST